MIFITVFINFEVNTDKKFDLQFYIMGEETSLHNGSTAIHLSCFKYVRYS